MKQVNNYVFLLFKVNSEYITLSDPVWPLSPQISNFTLLPYIIQWHEMLYQQKHFLFEMHCTILTYYKQTSSKNNCLFWCLFTVLRLLLTKWLLTLISLFNHKFFQLQVTPPNEKMVLHKRVKGGEGRSTTWSTTFIGLKSIHYQRKLSLGLWYLLIFSQQDKFVFNLWHDCACLFDCFPSFLFLYFFPLKRQSILFSFSIPTSNFYIFF